MIYEVSNRVTLDYGYRFYTIEACELATFTDGFSALSWTPTTLSAVEFLLSVRLYEPFRRWR